MKAAYTLKKGGDGPKRQRLPHCLSGNLAIAMQEEAEEKKAMKAREVVEWKERMEENRKRKAEEKRRKEEQRVINLQKRLEKKSAADALKAAKKVAAE